jgi:phosphoenolpyruvate-protein kinase (PTS system EI component)
MFLLTGEEEDLDLQWVRLDEERSRVFMEAKTSEIAWEQIKVEKVHLEHEKHRVETMLDTVNSSLINIDTERDDLKRERSEVVKARKDVCKEQKLLNESKRIVNQGWKNKGYLALAALFLLMSIVIVKANML